MTKPAPTGGRFGIAERTLKTSLVDDKQPGECALSDSIVWCSTVVAQPHDIVCVWVNGYRPCCVQHIVMGTFPRGSLGAWFALAGVTVR